MRLGGSFIGRRLTRLTEKRNKMKGIKNAIVTIGKDPDAKLNHHLQEGNAAGVD